MIRNAQEAPTLSCVLQLSSRNLTCAGVVCSAGRRCCVVWLEVARRGMVGLSCCVYIGCPVLLQVMRSWRYVQCRHQNQSLSGRSSLPSIAMYHSHSLLLPWLPHPFVRPLPSLTPLSIEPQNKEVNEQYREIGSQTPRYKKV